MGHGVILIISKLVITFRGHKAVTTSRCLTGREPGPGLISASFGYLCMDLRNLEGSEPRCQGVCRLRTNFLLVK